MPRRGAFVRLPDREEIRQFFEMRMLLEAESARLAALRNSHRAYSLLNPLLSEAESLLGVAEYLPKLSSMTPDFHRRITDLADNNILVAFTAQMADRTEWFARPSMATIAKQAWAEHRGIANAVEAGDSDRAADLAREHVRWAQEVYEEHNREQP
jgi:DNA-binding GntR family transcriptional regulator